MKRYHLFCPECKTDNIVLPAQKPEEPVCLECDEIVDLKELEKRVNGWLAYLTDRNNFLKEENHV